MLVNRCSPFIPTSVSQGQLVSSPHLATTITFNTTTLTLVCSSNRTPVSYQSQPMINSKLRHQQRRMKSHKVMLKIRHPLSMIYETSSSRNSLPATSRLYRRCWAKWMKVLVNSFGCNLSTPSTQMRTNKQWLFFSSWSKGRIISPKGLHLSSKSSQPTMTSLMSSVILDPTMRLSRHKLSLSGC